MSHGEVARLKESSKTDCFAERYDRLAEVAAQVATAQREYMSVQQELGSPRPVGIATGNKIDIFSFDDAHFRKVSEILEKLPFNFWVTHHRQ